MTIPNGITKIGSFTFAGCSSLTSVTIPNSVTSIEYGAFANCSSLKNVYYGGSQAQWGQIDIESSNDTLLSAAIHYNSTGN